MGFLSDLFKKVQKGIDEIEDVFDGDKDQSTPAPAQTEAPSYSAPVPEMSDDPWDVMPAEENQYNYSGSYVQYFEMIFREDFPEYETSYERANNRDAVIFTLKKDGATALVCELLSENSVAKKIRNDCKAAGIPYVRFYFNHHGWWNARSYVVNRIKSVL